MSKEKKSFILYCDQQGVFNKLPDEIAGKLIKHIFAYVNDEEPICNDLLLDIAFEPIKSQLKRDLRKYDEYIDKQRVNGAKGGRPMKPNETQITQAFLEKPKKADNVTDTVIATVNDIKVIRGFIKPSIQQIKEYMQERKMPDVSERFYDYYTANGWKVGKNAMKDWKATVRNWNTNIAPTPVIKQPTIYNPKNYE